MAMVQRVSFKLLTLYVQVDDARSSSLPVKLGVPQGILAPLLFLIYINDLPEHITHSECYLAADLSSLKDWCSAWKLKLNGRKCAHLSFTFSHKSSMFTDITRYSVGGFNIASVVNQKDLEIIVTNTLSGDCHYSKICKKKPIMLYI